MSDRFAKLQKIPAQPAARLLAVANAKLKTKLKAPASASVPAVLSELEAEGAHIDMLCLLSVSLPPREAVWWACLAARDMMAAQELDKSPCHVAAEAWVFDPKPENRTKLGTILEAADADDYASLAATAAFYAPGNLGDGEDMKDIPAPTGIVANCAFGMNLTSLDVEKDPLLRLDFLIDRAIDIARGGHGQIQRPVTDTETDAETETQAGAEVASPQQGSA